MMPVELADDRPAWEQQPDEGERPYAHFRAYLEHTTPRPPLAEFARLRGVKPVTINKHSAAHHWSARCAAYDSSVTTEVRAEIVRSYAGQADGIVERQTQVASKLNELARRELDKLLEASRRENAPILTARTLLQVIQMALAMDRLITSDDVNERLPLPDLGALSDGDLLTLRALAAKTTSGGGT